MLSRLLSSPTLRGDRDVLHLRDTVLRRLALLVLLDLLCEHSRVQDARRHLEVLDLAEILPALEGVQFQVEPGNQPATLVFVYNVLRRTLLDGLHGEVVGRFRLSRGGERVTRAGAANVRTRAIIRARVSGWGDGLR